MPRMISRTFPALLLASAAFVAFLPARASARDVVERFDFDVTGGRRVDQLDWNIAGDVDGHNPDVLSELTWKDLESNQVSLRGKLVMANNRFPFGGVVRAGLSYGEINSGTNQDSDYNGDGRTQEFSRSNSRSDHGNVWDASLGGGIVFANRARTLSLAPVAGFSYHEQNLTIHDGYQVLNDPANTPSTLAGGIPAVGPIAGLNSTYDSQWRTGWVGVDVDINPVPYFDVHATAEFHAGKYEAEADWNLRSDLQHPRSFRHTSDEATGVVASVGMRAGHPNLFVSVDYQYQKWQVDAGQDRTYYNDGSVWVTRLNEVNWEASSINAGVTVRF